ncbi:MAG: hypothetical protein H8D87_01765 [Deltaproteobacteria bacterium]|nr:hypothetical protein [Candidatus Desulfobacula maris]
MIQTVDNIAISQIQLFRARHTILIIGTLDALTGVMDYNMEEAQIAQAIIEQAESLTIFSSLKKMNFLKPFVLTDQSSYVNTERCLYKNLIKDVKK